MAAVNPTLQNYATSVFLGVCLLFGGAAHPGQASHLWLQLLSVIIIFALLFSLTRKPITRKSAVFLIGLFSISVWSLVQLAPLPASVWSSLLDREVLAKGEILLGAPQRPFLPISMVPENVLTSLLGFLPPLAAFLLVIALGYKTAIKRLFWIIPGLGAASAALGLAQVFAGPQSGLYFYEFTSAGRPVGVFSNINHQATLCLVSLIFVAPLASRLRSEWGAGDQDHAAAAAVGTLFLLNLVGVLAAGSIAGYMLLLVALALIAANMMLKQQETVDLQRSVAAFLGIVAIAALVVSSPALPGIGSTTLNDASLSRLGIWATTHDVLSDHWITGTGFGSFADVYRLYEEPALVTPTYVREAHNDYLQMSVEWGLIGISLIGLLLLYWLWLFFQVWIETTDRYSRFRRAAASALLIVLLHSLVDYPLRTPGMAVLAALCLAMMIVPHVSRAPKRSTTDETSAASRRLVI